jgi:hypothetical protein
MSAFVCIEYNSMKSVKTLEKTTFSGRRFTRKQLTQVQETVHTFQQLSRMELAQTICEHLNWKTPKGTNKIKSGLVLLEELEARGIITLPARRQTRAPVWQQIPLKKAEAPISGNLAAIGPISLQLATTDEERTSWKSYVQTYHYLGYKRPVGSHLYYFVVSEVLQQKLGCLLFSASAAWALAPRDQWIGWAKKHKRKLLNLILVQNRFLIFPWVKVPNLATKILSLATKQVGDDWVRINGYRPVLIETFVDTTKYSGASYRAANWRYLGETQGRGHDPKHEQNKSRKAIYAYPLQSDWQQCLTGGHQMKALKKRYRNDVQSSHSRSIDAAFVELWKRVMHIVRNVAEKYDSKWRVRRRLIDTLLLMIFIFRLVASKNKQSYATTIDEVWDSCRKLEVPLPQKESIAPSSLCAARKKLHEGVFKRLNQEILQAYARHDTERYHWMDHRVFAVDGTKINLPRELLEQGYKLPGDHSHYPQGLVSCLYELKSQMPIDFDLVAHGNERLCAEKHLRCLNPDDIVVYDRGYFSYVMLHLHCEAGIHAVFRFPASSCSEVNKFQESSATDVLVELYPSKPTLADIKSNHPDLNIVPRKMRLMKYTIGETTICLGTTLAEPKHLSYSLEAFKDLYHGRWGIEELYKISKNLIDVEDFHSKYERGVKQELFAHFALITMNRLLTNHTDQQLNQSPDIDVTTSHRPTEPTKNSPVMTRIKTNMKNCIAVFVRHLEPLLMLQQKITKTLDHICRTIARRFQRTRPGRSYQRKSLRPISKWNSPTKKAKTRCATPSAATT